MSIDLTHLDQDLTSTERLERDGLHAYLGGSFVRALSLLQHASLAHLKAGKIDRYVEVTTYVLRILAERNEFARIDETEKRILEVAARESLSDQLLARVHYILGVCRSFRIERMSEAKHSFDLAINHALEAQDRKALAYPIYGHAYLNFGNGDLDGALFQVERLRLILDSVFVSDLEVGTRILRGLIHRNQGEFDAAIAEMWKAYQALRERPNVVLYVHALHGLGSIYLRKGDHAIAKHYLELASGGLTESETPRLANMIRMTREKLEASQPKADFDYCLELEVGIVYDGARRSISLQGQFVLRDLAAMFFREPECVYSKAQIVEQVWNETYDPEAHDNRIYVTIRRLRRILEEGWEKNESVIVRAKGGYRLNPALRVKIV